MNRHPDELQVLAAKMEPARERYLKWKQVVDRYDRGKNTKFSQVFMRLRENMKEEPVSLVEKAAYADKEYYTYLDEWDKTEKEMIKAKVVFENLQAAYDALTSALAFDRESMKRLGG